MSNTNIIIVKRMKLGLKKLIRKFKIKFHHQKWQFFSLQDNGKDTFPLLLTSINIQSIKSYNLQKESKIIDVIIVKKGDLKIDERFKIKLHH